ncbi:MgtC/SapB family protein [Methylobacter sp. S3L5C]|uniref:MgtC/SapB family protein n=1 Tax=Methylobacter sp. S3L5C TaxID=2839024 RepID=UPI001FABE701|nr:MgtC/SapB family protein [Methylobacter sp. S3L5C]UOA07001.1 MgtC/SapB family protein [Methylobacter sp. S3L5C]
MTELENFKLLGIALAIGLLIGLERGWRTRDREEGMRVAGLRTYGMIGLLGGLSGILAQQVDAYLMGFFFLGLTAVLLLAYSKSLDKFADFSITSIIASLITFTLGALTVFGHIMLASASAVIITSLLGFKPLLHGWLKKLEQHELYATLKLLLISVVMLPILPNQGYGPWAAFNPYHIWLMVVLIAGISYLGYFAIRILGNQHGPVLTGALGGLVSSTAVTLNLSKLSAQNPTMSNVLAAGILTACATMFARTLLLTSVMNPALFQMLFPALLVMTIFTYLAAFLLWWNRQEFHTIDEITLENPFQLIMAMKFGAFLVIIMLLSNVLKIYFGDMGTYFLAATAGLADVDPITLSMAQMSKQGLEVSVAAKAILIAVSVNSGIKSIFSWFIGGRALALRVSSTLAGAVIAGLLIT